MATFPYFQHRPRPVFERISLVVSLTLIGLALFFIIDLPTRVLSFELFGTPLSMEFSQRWIMAAILGSIASSGTDAVVRAHPASTAQDFGYHIIAWILPGSLVILATWLLALAPTAFHWMLGLVAGGLLLWLVILGEYHLVYPSHAGHRIARLWLSLVGYGLALIFFVLIYQSRTRSAISATGILVLSGGFALSILRPGPLHVRRTWLFAGLIGFGMGQLTWVLNYWQLKPTAGGLFLVLAFYLMTGLARQELGQRLGRWTTVEFLALAAGATFAIFKYAT
jgi:hypothetical protein